MDQQDISYALAKQVPDMRGRGFTIGTSYGEINVPPGPLAEQLANDLGFALALKLERILDEAKEYEAAKRTATVPAAGAAWWVAQVLAGE